MSQRLYLDYDRSYHETEPAYLKDKNSKITEIEAYVSVLIENNRVYADQLNTLRRENTDLRGQIQVLMGDILRQRESSQQLLNNRKTEYSREVGNLIQELKDILNKKQQMEGSYKSLLQQLSYQNEFDKRARAIQIDQIERNYENKIKILNDRLSEQSKQLEQNYYLHSDNKLRMVKEIDQLKYENTQLKKINKDLREAHLFDENEIQRLSLNIKQLTKEREELGVNLLKVEQEKNNQLIETKQTMAQLREELNDQVDSVKKLEAMLFNKQKEYQSLAEKRDQELRAKNELEGNHIQQSYQINQKSSQVTDLTNELNRLRDFSNRELKRMSDLIRMLQNDNAKACSQKNEMESELQIKQNEVVSFLNKLKKLQAQHATATNTLMKIQQDNLQLKQIEAALRQDIDSLLLQLKNQQQKSHLQANRISTLEQIIEKEKKRNLHLQNSNNDREFISRQIPNELNRKYEAEIQQVLRRNEYQKAQILQRSEKEKQKLVRMYQKALRQKQTLFKEKIFLMESEIRQLGNF